RTAASAAGAQLAVAGGALLIPTVLAATASVKPLALEELSVVAAAALLLAYGAGLLFSLRTHAHLYMEERAAVMHGPGWSGRRAVVVLLLATEIEERRVGKECRSRVWPDHRKINE